jgi:hypothetical protein
LACNDDFCGFAAGSEVTVSVLSGSDYLIQVGGYAEIQGTGTLSIDCFSDPVINEFVANHTGTDTEAFVEVFGDPSTDYSTFTVLEIDGDGSQAGTIDAVLPVGTTNAGGYWIDPEDMENGTITILLVENFMGSLASDLDTNNDGTFDLTPWTRIVDDVATTDGGGSDRTYSGTVLGPFFDGNPFGAGGASRIPNGTDTDTTADWVRNDFDGFGLPGFLGSPAVGEAENTPDAVNNIISDGDNDGVPDVGDLCPDTAPADPVDAFGCSDAQVDADGDGVCAPTAPSGGPSGCTGTDWCGEAPPGDYESLEDCLYSLVDLNCSGVPRRQQAACSEEQLDACAPGCQDAPEPPPPPRR